MLDMIVDDERWPWIKLYGLLLFNNLNGFREKIDLKNPREAWKRPAKKVEVKANWRNKIGSCVGETSCLNIDPINSDAIDTGPTARSLELPSTAYTSGGTKLESTTFNIKNK